MYDDSQRRPTHDPASVPSQGESLRVQALQLVLIASVILLAVAVLAVQHRRITVADRPWPRLLLGVVPGVIGAVVILVSRTDLVPDEFENDLWLVVAVVITAGAALGTVYRLARR